MTLALVLCHLAWASPGQSPTSALPSTPGPGLPRAARTGLHRHWLGRRSPPLWRGNKYIARDGILPYQRCGSNATVAQAHPLYAVYRAGQASYSLLVLATSAWGVPRSDGKAPLLESVELLAFDTPSNQSCTMSEGEHCKTAMSAAHAQRVGAVSCEFYFGGPRPLASAGSIRPPTTPRGFNAFIITCPVPGGAVDAAAIPDQWRVSVSLGGARVPVDMCYDHVDAPIEIALCMETAFGYSRASPFWAGNPRFRGNHTMVDAALTYHTDMMGAHVRFNDVSSAARDAVLPYTRDGRVSYRSGWRLSSLLRMSAGHVAGHAAGQQSLVKADAADVVAAEVLVNAACQWEFRYRARWTAMISSVDNFAAPIEDVSLVEALRRAPVENVSTILVPIVEGFSINGSLTAGPNVLLRYPVAGPELAFGDTRHIPIIDPRHLDAARIHWATEFRPHAGLGRTTWGPNETLAKLQVHAVHLMALTRPERDMAGSRGIDGLLWKRGMELQARLDGRGLPGQAWQGEPEGGLKDASRTAITPCDAAARQRDRAHCLASTRSAILDEVCPYFHGNARVALLGVPSHGNLGDSILHLAEVEAAALCGKSVAVTCRMREKSAWPACPPPAQLLDSLGADPLILLHAGGNWGDVWPEEQRPRLDYLNRLDAELSARNSSARVVQLPQSLYYSDSHTRAQDEAALANLRNINLTIYARQASSLAHAPSPAPRLAVKLLPDMAFVLSPVTVPEPMVDVLVIARTDKESVLGMPHANVSALANTVLGPHNITFQVLDWVKPSFAPRPGELELASPGSFPLIRWHAATALVGSARVVITDRMHASVVALLADRPHIILDTSYRKLSGVRDLALKETGAACSRETLREHRAQDVRGALELARAILLPNDSDGG